MKKCQSDCFVQRIHKFLRGVQAVYKESWVAHSGSRNNVFRGRARCVAGQVEDLFGETVYDILNKHIKGLIVFVDLPLSYERNDNGKRLKTICYPDVVVAQRNESQIRILYLMEVKVNFGWGRHKLAGEGMFKNDKTGKKERRVVTPIEDDVKVVLQKLIGVKIWSKIPYGMTAKKNSTEVTKNSELQFVVSKDTKYDLIICSSKNVPKDALQKARERIGEDVNAVCQLYVLSDKELSLKYASKKQRPEGDSLLCSKDVNKWKCRINALVDGWLQYKK